MKSNRLSLPFSVVWDDSVRGPFGRREFEFVALRRMFVTRPELTPVAAVETREKGEVAVEVDEDVETPWRVILFNDAIHTFDEVITQLVKATGCSSTEAEQVAWTVHTKGKAMAFEGSFPGCFRVQGVLREIQLVTEIQG